MSKLSDYVKQKLSDYDWMYDQYIIMKKNTVQIGKELICDTHTINNYLKKHNISIRNRVEAQGISKELLDKLNDKTWLYDQYITLNKSAAQLSEELECSCTTIYNYLKKYDIIIRTNSEANGISKEVLDSLNDKQWLYNQYIIMKKSTVQLGEELHCSSITINNYLKKYNIPIRHGSEANGISKELLHKLNDKDFLYNQYIIENKNTYQLGEELECSEATINKYLKKCDIPIRQGGNAQGISKELLDKLNNKTWLYDQYITNHKNTYQLEEELGCSDSTILNYIKKHDIPINYSYSRSYGENQVFEFVKHAMQSYKINNNKEKYIMSKLSDYVKQKLNNYNWMYDQYIVQKNTTVKIGNILNCNPQTVNKFLRLHNIDIKSNVSNYLFTEDSINKLKDKKYLEILYIDENKSPKDIAIILNCSGITVSNWLKKHNIKLKTHRESLGVSKELLNNLNNVTLLKKLYIDENRSIKEIGNIFNCSSDIIYNSIKKHNIKKNISEVRGISKETGAKHTPQSYKINNKEMLNDYDWLYDQYITMKKGTVQIGKELGCPHFTVNWALKKHDIPIKNNAEAQGISKDTLVLLNDNKWIYNQYITMKKSTYQIGEEFGCSYTTIGKYIKKHGIPIRNNAECKGISKELLDKLNDKEWLYDQYVTKKKSVAQVGDELECLNGVVRSYMKKHNIPIRNGSDAHLIPKELYNKLNDKQWLYDQYITMKKGTVKICNELECSHFTIIKALKKHDIPLRSNSESKGLSKELYNKLNDKDFLYDQYITNNKNTIQMGEELGGSHVTINRYLRKHDISIRTISEAQGMTKELLDKLNDKEWLYDQYVTKKKSVAQVGDGLECSWSTVLNYLKKHDIPINRSYSRSYGENQVFEFVKQDYPDVIQSYKIGRKEVDIFIPSKNVGIEFNGIYWHTEEHKGKDYHLDKTILCEENGIQLLHIFEDEWNDSNKQEIWKSIILNKLGLTPIKIPARKCRIVELVSSKATEFHNEHHLHGACISKEHIGLVYNDEIMMVLSHGKSRYRSGELEIHRITTKKNTIVQGGLSRLIKQLPSGIYMTYCDKRYGTGKSYNDQFKLIGESSPNYSWIKGSEKYTRVNCQKHKLQKKLGDQFREEWSETENMTNAGYNKLYDCGNYKFKLEIL